MIRRMLAAWWTACADRRRAAGRYDRTLRLWRWRAWCLAPGARNQLRLARSWHDAGLALPGRWRRALESLARSGRPAHAREARRMLGSLGGDAAQPMAARRQAFADWLAARLAAGPAARVCVVGNAEPVPGEPSGDWIDRQAVVIRFNRWGRGDQRGRRTDVWVLAPDLASAAGTAPPAGLGWAVVSGADPAGRLPDWPGLTPCLDQGVPVLTVPLPVWGGLVDELHAPPSAGLLLLAWLRALPGVPPQSVVTVGIGGDGHVRGAVHWRGRRHRWEAERGLLARWRAAGFTRPGDGGAA